MAGGVSPWNLPGWESGQFRRSWAIASAVFLPPEVQNFHAALVSEPAPNWYSAARGAQRETFQLSSPHQKVVGANLQDSKNVFFLLPE